MKKEKMEKPYNEEIYTL